MIIAEAKKCPQLSQSLTMLQDISNSYTLQILKSQISRNLTNRSLLYVWEHGHNREKKISLKFLSFKNTKHEILHGGYMNTLRHFKSLPELLLLGLTLTLQCHLEYLALEFANHSDNEEVQRHMGRYTQCLL